MNREPGNPHFYWNSKYLFQQLQSYYHFVLITVPVADVLILTELLFWPEKIVSACTTFNSRFLCLVHYPLHEIFVSASTTFIDIVPARTTLITQVLFLFSLPWFLDFCSVFHFPGFEEFDAVFTTYLSKNSSLFSLPYFWIFVCDCTTLISRILSRHALP